MGLFYSNLTVYGAERSALLSELRRLERDAFISQTFAGHTVVFDRLMDEQDSEESEKLGCDLTKTLACSALAAVVHDDDVLYLWLFQKGRVRDRYDSMPGYFDTDADEPGPPVGGDADLLCGAFGRTEHA